MTDPLPAAGEAKAALEAAIAAMAAHLETECPTIGQADADVKPISSGRLGVSLALHGGKGGDAGLTLTSPPAPLAEALQAAAAGGRLHVICNRRGGQRAWRDGPDGCKIAAGRRSRTTEQTAEWVSAARLIEDGQSILLGADEAAAHARLRQQALHERFLLLRWLHRERTGRPLRIHRAGDTVFACSLGPGPAMADSFHALHLPAGRTGA